MPSTKIVVNRLWRFICPSVDVISPSGATLLSNLTPGPRRQCRITSQRNSTRRLSQTPQVASRSQAWKIYGGGQRRVNKAAVFTTTELRHQDRVRQLDLSIAYQALRQSALSSQYPHTQACVNILVKERGEKPNLRLYDALLLANTDHEHGSASEVARLFEELASEGLTPDSATYHAALRVSIAALRRRTFVCLYSTGACYPSGLSPTMQCP